MTLTSTQRRALVVASLLTVAALAMALYGRALDFAFFNDDPSGHFAWMEGRGLLDYFRTSAEYGYYRPIVFTTLQSFVNLFGYDARWFHALLLALHGANVAMVWLLAWRLGRGRSFAFPWLAALMFASVPFSYEAVAYVASLTHPLVTFWTLVAALLYQQARTRSSRPRFFLFAAYLAMIMALFSHENGLIVPALLYGIDWLSQRPSSLRDAIRRPALWFLIAPALFLLLWLSIPKTGETSLPTLASLWRNSLPFLQTLVYPLLPLARLDSSQSGLLLALAAFVLALTGLCAAYARRLGVWLFGLMWFGLSSLPAIAFLSSDYLYGSPRLSYLPAVGVALMWGMVALALARLPATQAWQKAGVALVQMALLLAVVVPPLSFIRCELDFYATTSDLVREMGRISAEIPEEQPLVFVNTPFFFSSTPQHPEGCPNPYAWTPVGAVVVPEYARVGDFARFNGGEQRTTSAVTVPEYAPGWATVGDPLALTDLRERVSTSAVYVFDLNALSFFPLSQAWQPDQPLATPQAQVGDALTLVDSAVGVDVQRIGGTLTWQVVAPTDRPATLFIHVVDPAGGMVAQHDAPLAGGKVPPALWQAGDLLSESFEIALPAPLPPGSRVLAGIYDPTTADRWPASAEGAALPDNAIVITQVSAE